MKKLSLLIFIMLLFPSTSFCEPYDFFGPTSCRYEFLTFSKEYLSECVNALIKGINETRERTSQDSKFLPLRIDTLEMAQSNLKDKLKDAESEIEFLTRRISMLEDEVKSLKQRATKKAK